MEFDDDDPRCLEITEGRSIDVLEIDGASNNGVEQVRELRETAKYAPASSKFKIYIIDEVHMLSTAAFNALLKTLEEPPAHVKFMFATTDPEKVLPTILSRCQRFDLRRIPVALIVSHLAGIAKQENVEIEDSALYAIARGSDGGMRDAESALDQLISFCGNRILEGDVLSMFGLTSQAQVLSLSNGVLQGDAEAVLRELNSLAKHGKDLGRLLSDVLGHFRNLLIFQVARGDLTLMEVSETEAASLAQQSALITPEALTEIMEVLTGAEGGLRDASSKKIFVEVALLKAIQARNAVSIDTVLKQLQQLRSESGGNTIPPSTTALSGVPATARISATPTVGSGESKAAAGSIPTDKPAAVAEAAASSIPTAMAAGEVKLEQLWQGLLDAVGRASPFTRSYLNEAFPVSLANGVFTIGFDPEFADKLELVNNSKTHAVLQTKLQELGYAQIQIKFVKTDSPAPRPIPSSVSREESKPASTLPTTSAVVAGAKAQRASPEPGKVSVEEFKNDPLIQKALEVFKGQIVEVRA